MRLRAFCAGVAGDDTSSWPSADNLARGWRFCSVDLRSEDVRLRPEGAKNELEISLSMSLLPDISDRFSDRAS